MGDAEPLLVVGCVRQLVLTPGDEAALTLEVEHAGGTKAWGFSGVRNLHVSDPGTHWPITLQLVDITDRGWGGVNLEITDPEEGSLRFWCRDVVVADVTVDPRAHHERCSRGSRGVRTGRRGARRI